MSQQHFMTVCVVCVLCATHQQCSAHTDLSLETPAYQDNTIVHAVERHERDVIPLVTEDRVGNIGRSRLKKVAHSEKIKLRFMKNSEVFEIDNMSPMESREVLERLGHLPVDNPSSENKNSKRINKRHVNNEENFYLKKIFDTYGDGNSLSMSGFERMLKKLGLTELITNIEREKITDNSINGSSGSLGNSSPKPNQTCLNKKQLIENVAEKSYESSTNNGTMVPGWLFENICPVLLYHLSSESIDKRNGCISAPESSHEFPMGELNQEDERNMIQVWVYSIISIVIISLCGLLGVAVIPVMGKSYYHHLLQFLVALAIGTLCGDALIHLLPHAMMAQHSHNFGELQTEVDSESQHKSNMWKGLIAMMGLIMFFFTEKALSMIAEWRKHCQRKNQLPSRVRVMRETEVPETNTVGEKLCKHKYSSYPYCYGEITTETRDNHHEHLHNDKERPPSNGAEETKPLNDNSNSVSIIDKDNSEKKVGENWQTIGDTITLKKGDEGTENSLEAESYTVIIREHENKHHGHTHSHGHVHAAPESMSSVAWMVIMGDGLHNFTDGMAIGAAFAANIAGGFSTAIAVFCHELPHELGDFAVLIKAGMSAKQAVFYNLLSSVLCLFGMIIGVLVGATPEATSWIFAAAAGMFIYIALVDMIPELSSGHSEEGGSNWQCVLQAMGLLSGLGIMLVIAMYEHDLKHIFSN